MKILLPLLVVIAGGFALEAAATVHKCKGADGTLTYQELPCDAADQALRSDIASDFPPPNLAERERLLLREEEMNKRLEAERERWSKEKVARLSKPDPVAVVPEAPVSVIWAPAYRAPPRPRPRGDLVRAWPQGPLR